MKHASILVACAVLAGLPIASIASAQRKPSPKERAQIASVVALRARCAKVRVSTVSPKPKWGSVAFRPNGPTCKPFASDGVTVVHKQGGRWKLVIAGSSFGCGELYSRVPKPVAQDLRVPCESTPA